MDLKQKCLDVVSLLEQEYPAAATKLIFDSVFQLVIAVVLSAQSTDEQVNHVTARLFKKYPTVYELAAADIQQLEQDIRGVGLHRNKSKNIFRLAQILVERYDGEVPMDFSLLLQLPGVGRKSANVIQSVGFNIPAFGVDTHVIRLTNRLGLVNTTNPKMIEKDMKNLLPIEKWSKAHHLLIFHGRQVCRSKKPQCNKCVLDKLCPKIIN
ncbi:MAG TPA: endonuclease III [Syntrophomonadaceae bacterium]|nr:endonuclease III [Syntrophomonadaceae bacterium]